MDRNLGVRAPGVSFIIRLARDDVATPQMRGEIELIATGEKRYFFDSFSLLDLLESWRHDLEVAS